MKILEEKVWSLVISCHGCKSKLEIVDSDVKAGRFGGNYIESGELHPYVTCPICGNDIIIPWGNLTSKTNSRIERSRRYRS